MEPIQKFLLAIVSILISFIVASFFLLSEKRHYSLPEQYLNYSVVKEEMIDVDGDGEMERIAILSNIPTEYASGITKMIMVRKNGIFTEITEDGSVFQWWNIGDFNNNGKTDIAVFYGYSGSAGFGQFYLQEWNGNNFDLLLSKNDVENKVEMSDLDNDGVSEIIYDFHKVKWGEKEREIYKWKGNKMELV